MGTGLPGALGRPGPAPAPLIIPVLGHEVGPSVIRRRVPGLGCAPDGDPNVSAPGGGQNESRHHSVAGVTKPRSDSLTCSPVSLPLGQHLSVLEMTLSA